MAETAGIPALPVPGGDYDPEQQTQLIQAVELSLQELSSRLADVTELSEDNLAALVDGLGEQDPLVDTDKVIVRTADGVEYVEASSIGGAGGGWWMPPLPGLWRPFGTLLRYTTAITAGIVVANTAYAIPFMPLRAVTITDLGAWCTASQTGSIAIGLYDSDPDTGLPDSLLASTGKQTVVSGANTFSITNQALEAGTLYYCAVVVTSSTPSWKGYGLTADEGEGQGVGISAFTSSEPTGPADPLGGSWTDLASTFAQSGYGTNFPVMFGKAAS